MVSGQGHSVYPNDISGDGGLTVGNNIQSFEDVTALNPSPVQDGGGKRKQKRKRKQKKGKSKKRKVRRSKGRRTKHCKCKVCRCKTCKCNKKRSRMTKRR